MGTCLIPILLIQFRRILLKSKLFFAVPNIWHHSVYFATNDRNSSPFFLEICKQNYRRRHRWTACGRTVSGYTSNTINCIKQDLIHGAGLVHNCRSRPGPRMHSYAAALHRDAPTDSHACFMSLRLHWLRKGHNSPARVFKVASCWYTAGRFRQIKRILHYSPFLHQQNGIHGWGGDFHIASWRGDTFCYRKVLRIKVVSDTPA